MDTKTNSIGGIPSITDKLIISGPCSVETEEQLFETASRLSDEGKTDVLRAGIWKPRTRPNSFEGVGAEGLSWLVSAGKTFGMPVTTEVAKASHVEEALKAGVDILWLGARTTVNPFSVQEIADALKGVKIPVMVKNPINPDLELWMGAIERIQLAGIENVLAIHRGFSSFAKTIYRNVPMWEIPIQLRMRMPELPIICDPSHISGRRDLLAMVAQKAYDLTMDGLMLETHRLPDEAWSDVAQQITPEQFSELLRDLVPRKSEVKDWEQQHQLEKLRSEIDALDESIINIFAQRMDTAKNIGRYKKDHNITILQVNRWKEIYDARKNLAIKMGLSEDFIEVVLTAIHKESIQQQNNVMNQN